MMGRLFAAALVAAAAAGAVPLLVDGAVRTIGDNRITRDATSGSYLRYDGQSDATTAACSVGRRPQNEPTVAVDPRATNVVTAGSNDYCLQTANGDTWAGF